MPKKQEERARIIEEISSAGRKMSTYNIFFHQAIAKKAGLTGTDHKYADMLFQKGPMTAGQLAALSGITTGAATGLIDRLEKNGLVKRQGDPTDRRKVLIVPDTEKAMQLLGPIFKELGEEMDFFYKKFTTDELKVILRYLEESADFFAEKTRKLKDKP